MRIIVCCIVLLILPPLAIVAVKLYVPMREEKSLPQPQFHQRGEVLFFNASWCGPCRQMKPIVAQMRREGYHMRDIDVDKNRNLAQKYGIRGIPTFVFVENGAEVRRFSGGTSGEHLKQLCEGPMYH